MQRVLYPDIEKLLVGYLSDGLTARFGVGAVRVGTLKVPAGEVQPAAQVVVTANYQGDLDWVRQAATGTFEVYADGYEFANELGLFVAALAVNIPMEFIKRAAVIMGPVRTVEDGPQEKRNIMVDYVVKGDNF